MQDVFVRDPTEKRGQRLIHKNYASWVNNVLTDLSRGLQLSANE